MYKNKRNIKNGFIAIQILHSQNEARIRKEKKLSIYKNVNVRENKKETMAE